GGHCIGVDPYYLLYKAKELGYHAKMIDSGRFINDSMGGYVAKQLVKKMIAKDINIKGARVLVMGVTFKEDVSDIRNSKVVDLINELKQYSIKVDVIDPQASHHEIKEEYGFDMVKTTTGKYDGVVVAVQHEEYKNLPESYFKELMNPNAIFVDLKGIYRSKLNNLNYWSL
ncbi:MAG TPA: nucleotide sugar dehydrogenase, partial [Marinilabiliales bacterium]|nr:nucleotide sugar dehydrogenase [Marinilabiliales bacterium]